MIRIPDWLLKLDVMSQIQVDVMLFLLAACVIATLAVLILSQPQEATIWKLALGICIVLTSIGMIVAFTPPPFAKYAALFRMWGEWIMLVLAVIIRFRKTESWTLVRVGKIHLVVYAAGAVVLAGLVAMPFFTVVNSQDRLQNKQNSIFELVYTAIVEIRGLRADLARDHQERIEQHYADSVERANIKKTVNTIKVDVHQSLVNDSNVKRALGKSSKLPTARLFIDTPKPKGFPGGNFTPPSTEWVKPVPSLNRKGRKITYADSLYKLSPPLRPEWEYELDPLWPGHARPVAKMYEF